ncbi:hypothetical protein C7S16_5522 [Burkholderia thailandensis]|uniref:Uncharacterized protein n=1 Tax=Burkholderia thailandensis TaxID=57975 RepID=A0AAW9CPR4_BURTH|nr:hypothetical protein [Burkholderia thailandensis]MDW9252599.1 hypothetical protein [Burkholderia thailandensis]
MPDARAVALLGQARGITAGLSATVHSLRARRAAERRTDREKRRRYRAGAATAIALCPLSASGSARGKVEGRRQSTERPRRTPIRPGPSGSGPLRPRR